MRPNSLPERFYSGLNGCRIPGPSRVFWLRIHFGGTKRLIRAMERGRTPDRDTLCFDFGCTSWLSVGGATSTMHKPRGHRPAFHQAGEKEIAGHRCIGRGRRHRRVLGPLRCPSHSQIDRGYPWNGVCCGRPGVSARHGRGISELLPPHLGTVQGAHAAGSGKS